EVRRMLSSFASYGVRPFGMAGAVPGRKKTRRNRAPAGGTALMREFSTDGRCLADPCLRCGGSWPCRGARYGFRAIPVKRGRTSLDAVRVTSILFLHLHFPLHVPLRA